MMNKPLTSTKKRILKKLYSQEPMLVISDHQLSKYIESVVMGTNRFRLWKHLKDVQMLTSRHIVTLRTMLWLKHLFKRKILTPEIVFLRAQRMQNEEEKQIIMDALNALNVYGVVSTIRRAKHGFSIEKAVEKESFSKTIRELDECE